MLWWCCRRRRRHDEEAAVTGLSSSWFPPSDGGHMTVGFLVTGSHWKFISIFLLQQLVEAKAKLSPSSLKELNKQSQDFYFQSGFDGVQVSNTHQDAPLHQWAGKRLLVRSSWGDPNFPWSYRSLFDVLEKRTRPHLPFSAIHLVWINATEIRVTRSGDLSSYSPDSEHHKWSLMWVW